MSNRAVYDKGSWTLQKDKVSEYLFSPDLETANRQLKHEINDLMELYRRLTAGLNKACDKLEEYSKQLDPENTKDSLAWRIWSLNEKDEK